LTDHGGDSRVIMTSRIAPAGLDPATVPVRPVHALSRDESLLLARELPNSARCCTPPARSAAAAPRPPTAHWRCGR
jgi:hypothetical protein